MPFNVADLFEAAVDRVPEREAIVCGSERRTFRQLEERANRLAHVFLSLGLGRGSHVGIYSFNSIEWVESMLAAYKVRAIPININYRYVEDELLYLFGNADFLAVVHQKQFAPRLAALRGSAAWPRHCIAVEDGSGADCAPVGAIDYESAVAPASPKRDFEPRSGDDIYLLYTGGTTGMPKGVLWRQEDVIFTLGGGIDAITKERARCPEDITNRIREEGFLTHCPLAPLMHGAAQWTVLGQLFVGNKIVLMPGSFDPHETWKTVERERVNGLMITGDAVARPLVEALAERSYDLSSLIVLSSSAAVLSPSVKREFLDRLPNLMLIDALGASEQGMTGLALVTPDSLRQSGTDQPALRINPDPDVAVFDDELRPVPPGSGRVGKLARTGNVPLGYYKDTEKSAQVFLEIDGKRWSIPGDLATVEADGTITVLGRGSTCINSGGEKIYPEEVEAALKAHPAVFDALVVGVPDPRWGQKVAALVECRPGREVTLRELDQHCRTLIAGYKIPRELHVVDRIRRSPSGKPDYPWASRTAAEGAFRHT